MGIVSEIHNARTLLAFFQVTDRNAALQVLHKLGVFLYKFAVFKIAQFE